MRIGFIGLGTMGASMAHNLLQAGLPVSVHDVRPEAAAPHLAAGATWADSPAAMAAACDAVFTCLPNLDAIEAVALGPDGLITAARPGFAFFEMSTNSPELVRRLHAAFDAKGATMLDAPISGGKIGAATRRLERFHPDRNPSSAENAVPDRVPLRFAASSEVGSGSSA